MPFLKISAIAGALALASRIAAHGTVTGIVADGVYYEGYHTSFQYLTTQPVVVGWSIPEDLSNGFIAPDAYNSSDIICHLNATNAQTSAAVKPGGTVEFQWTVWPVSHHGPVIDYLANCNGDCRTVDKTTLKFFKIDGVGLINDTVNPGTWASDELIANNNSWTVTIPKDIAPGNYVLRHEIIALHSAENVDGAQNYPQCVNVEISGSGSATPSGVLGTALYSETDPGIEVDIYQTLSTYIVPGPSLYSGAVSIVQPTISSGASFVGSSAGSATSVAASSSALVTSVASSVASSASQAVTSTASSEASGAAKAVTTIASHSSGHPHSSNATVSMKNSASSAAKAVTTIASYSSGLPHSSNSTVSTKKSACKSKTKSGSAFNTTSAGTAAASTYAASVTIPTSSPGVVGPTSNATYISPVASSMTSSVPAASATGSGVTEPAGTTLADLLSWLSGFFNSYTGTSYSGSTVARRHSRAIRV